MYQRPYKYEEEYNNINPVITSQLCHYSLSHTLFSYLHTCTTISLQEGGKRWRGLQLLRFIFIASKDKNMMAKYKL